MKCTKIIIGILIVLFQVSCASLKIPNNFNSIINESNIEEIEGNYTNKEINSITFFWNLFCSSDFLDERKIISDSSSYFNIEIVSNERIKFELYTHDILQFTNIYTYSYLDGGIAIKGNSNYRYQGIPLIFYRYASSALWLSKDKSNELYVSHNGNSSGGILIMIFGTERKGEARFKRKDKY